MSTIANMSLDELKKLIAETVDERLRGLLGQFELSEETFFAEENQDNRSWEDVRRDIETDRWTPPAGAKSSLELLREDREN